MPSHTKQNIATTSSNKQSSSVMKLKQKNKRRNRKKKKQKLQYPIHEMQQMTNNNTTSMYTPSANVDANSSFNNQMAIARMWAKTYEKMIRLQYQHRIHYWKNLALNRNAEIDELKVKLETNRKYQEDSDSIDENDANSECTSQENGDETESYLKFLEITLRHRQQRKHNREAEKDSD